MTARIADAALAVVVCCVAGLMVLGVTYAATWLGRHLWGMVA